MDLFGLKKEKSVSVFIQVNLTMRELLLSVCCSAGLFVERSPSAEMKTLRGLFLSKGPILTTKTKKQKKTHLCCNFKGLHLHHEHLRISSPQIHLSKSQKHKSQHAATPPPLYFFVFMLWVSRPVTCHGRRHQNHDLPAGSCGHFAGLHRGVFRPGNESD